LFVDDSVVVLQRSGCFSSEIITQSECVIKISNNTDLLWAASLPVNFFTASHALSNIVHIFPSSDVLITSAAGGVGGMLTQLASGSHRVTGLVGSEQKKDYVSKLGAQVALTYQEFYEQECMFDVIFISSGDNLGEYYRRLKPNGKIIMFGFHSIIPRGIKTIARSIYSYCNLPTFKPFDLVYKNKTVSGFNIIHLQPASREFQCIKKQFSQFLDENRMPANHTVSSYHLHHINQALSDLAAGSTVGKVVIKF
jgi:NADPH:quinone reductase-like Zn-dependent oxidoreductase